MNDSSLTWRTSSYSGNADGNCVEVARTPNTTHVRDTKARSAGTQHHTADAWSGLLTHLRAPTTES